MNTELELYSDPDRLPGLPPICFVWSERYLLPLIQEVGFPGLDELFDEHVAEQCARRFPESARLVSLGAGAGETEIGIAVRLAQRGIENLDITLLELSPQLIEQALADAQQRGIGDRVNGVAIDLNGWHPDGAADVFFANHSLHHIVELENVFDGVTESLHAEGVLLVNDMIGRNGHVRWPEAGDLVRRIWHVAPERYRFNHFEKHIDDVYPDIDCSAHYFEGVRAQDILPLLLERFHPDVYVTFANIIDPFIDRIYGPNFDIEDPDDVAFIRSVASLDDAAVDLGLVTPTHLIGSFRTYPVPCRYPRGRSPERTLRVPELPAGPAQSPDGTKDRLADAQAADCSDAEMTAVRLELNEARERYAHLRQRKAVCIALKVAALRPRMTSLLRRATRVIERSRRGASADRP